MAHGRSRSGNCSCLSPLVGGTSVLCLVCSHVGTPEYERYGPPARTLVGSEDEAEHVDALLLGVHRTYARAQAGSEVSYLGRIGIDLIEVVGLAA
jgi:hypothetical protein